MRILYVSSLYPPAIGGAQIQLHHLARAAQAAGADVSALCYSDRNRTDWLRFATFACETPLDYEYEGIAVHRMGFRADTRLRMLPWAATYYPLIVPASRAIARLTQPYVAEACAGADLIHLTRIGREFIARACLEQARAQGIPFVLTPNHHPRWRGWRYAEYDNLYREADALIVYTESEKETLARDIGVDTDKIFVTGVGPIVSEEYSEAAFRVKHGLEGQRYVLFLGQQYEYKGMAGVLGAAERVWAEFPDVRFVFIGPHTPYSRELFQGVTDPRVLNLGAVPMADKAAALAGCEFLCMPSMQESFGGVYIEAWCYGKAAIGGRIPAIRCVIDDGVNGLLSSQDPAELAGHISALLRDPERCARMGEAGRAKGRERFSWERIAERTLEIYRSLLPQHAAEGAAT